MRDYFTSGHLRTANIFHHAQRGLLYVIDAAVLLSIAAEICHILRLGYVRRGGGRTERGGRPADV